MVRVGSARVLLQSLSSDLPIGDLKAKIKEILHVPRSHQILIYEGEEMLNHQTLAECKDMIEAYAERKKDPSLYISLKPMTILVSHPLGGLETSLVVDALAKIGEIKTLLQAKVGLCPGEMRLVFRGKEMLQDDRTLGFYKVKPDSVLKCKTISRLWTETSFLLSLVASFLQLKDVVKLMSALRHSSRLVGDVVIAPSAELLGKMIERAVPEDVELDCKNNLLRWTHLGKQGAAQQHSQMVTLPELRMLHHLLQSIPIDLKLAWGRVALNETGKDYVATGVRDFAADVEPGALVTCTLSAQIQTKGQGVELKVKSKRCCVESCHCVVLRTCPACKDVCNACLRQSHAEECDECGDSVCPSCIVPDNTNHDDEQEEDDETRKLCTKCGFHCSACSGAVLLDEKYCCSAGAAACKSGRPLICHECVFDNGALVTSTCDECSSIWCQVCVPALSYFCPTGHMTCTNCRAAVIARCKLHEDKWGICHDISKNCRRCWTLAYAQLKGFDSTHVFLCSIANSQALNDALGSSPLLQKRVQYWGIDGGQFVTSKKFDTCCFLPTRLECMSAVEKADCGTIHKLLATLSVTHIFVSSSAEFVNGISCLNMDAPRNASVQMPVGRDGSSQSRTTLTLAVGERIVSIRTRRSAEEINSLRFVTSTGREIAYGGAGGNTTTNYRVPVGWRLAGFFGGVSGRLRNLGVVIAKETW